jgi:hypothetical protein
MLQHTQITQTPREIDTLRQLLYAVDERNNSSTDAIRAEIALIRLELAALCENLHAITKNQESYLTLTGELINRLILE